MSPNLGPLQTQQREKALVESEPGSTSDTKAGKSARRVRTWVNFRHKSGKKRSQSPNLDQLQTKKREKAQAESEPGSTSDKEAGKTNRRV
ncbi:hypothetical protein C1N70_23590 [Cytobacillus firmus]